MSTNLKNTASEKKDAVVPASGSESGPSNAGFLGACGSTGFLPLLEKPSPAEETQPDQADSLMNCLGAASQPQEEGLEEETCKEDDIFDVNGGLKNCPGAFPVDVPQEEGLKEETCKEDDIFDADGGLKNCPGAFPVDVPEDSDESTKAENQVGRKELDRYKVKKD